MKHVHLLGCILIFSSLVIGFGVHTGAANPAARTLRLESSGAVNGTMYRSNPAHTGEQPGPGPAGKPSIAWEFETDGQVESSPTVVHDVAYFGSLDGFVYAADARTGEEFWRFDAGDEIWSSPAVVDDVVYVGAFGGVLYALDAETGAERWRLVTGDFDLASPTVVDGVVYVGGGSVYAVDAATGSELWRFGEGGLVSSSPAVEEGAVYVVDLGSQTLYCLDASDGRERWRVASGASGYNTDADPSVSEGVAYFASINGNVYAIDTQTGDELWRITLPRQPSSATAVVNGVVYIGDATGRINALDAETGAEIWHFQAYVNNARIPSMLLAAVGSPALSQASALVSSANVGGPDAIRELSLPRAAGGGLGPSTASVADGVVYFGSPDGNLFALDWDTGRERWRVNVGSVGHSSPAIVDGIVYIGSSDGEMVALG